MTLKMTISVIKSSTALMSALTVVSIGDSNDDSIDDSNDESNDDDTEDSNDEGI